MRVHYWSNYDGSRQLDFHTARGGIGVRIGRPEWRSFSERYQGKHGIPRRYWYALGGRLTLIKLREFPSFAAAVADSEPDDSEEVL